MSQSQYIVRPAESQSGYIVRPRPTGALTVPQRGLVSYTQYDPSGILQAVAQVGAYIAPTLQNPATVSANPLTGVSWSVPARDLGGDSRDSDIFDLLTAVILWAGNNDPPSADMRLMAGLTDAPVQTASFGMGVTLTASGADWQIGHLVFPAAGAWTHTAGGAANANTRGGRASARHVNTATQRGVGACALDSTGAEIAGSSASVPGTSAVSDGLDYFFLAAGWATGVGGTGGVQVLLTGFELILKQLLVTGTGRP